MINSYYNKFISLGHRWRFSPLDYATVVTSFASIVTGIFFLLFYEDNISPLRDLKPIANVGEYSSSPQRKIVGTLAWNGIQTKEVLFRGDQILTDQGSKIEVLFLDETFLKIPPNSLIKLDFNNGEFDIELIKGFLDINLKDGNERVTIRKGDKRYKIEGEKGKIQVVSGLKSLQFKTLSGDIKVDGRDPSQLGTSSKALYQIAKPLTQTVFNPLKEKSLNVDLRPADLTQPGKVPPPDVVISRYPNLRNAQKVKTTANDLKNGLELKLPRPGLYYLGVKEPGATEYKITPFEVTSFTAPQLLGQKEKKTALVSQGEKVALGWVGRNDLTYEIEVQAGKRKEIFEVIDSKKLLPIFKSADLRYRVRVKAPKAPWSEWGKQKVQVSPGLIVDKKETPDILVKKTLRAPISFALASQHKSKKGFYFEVAKDKEFKTVLLKKKTQENRFNSDRLKPGTYYWRSETLDRPSKTTGVQKLIVKAPAIILTSNFKNNQFSASSKPVASFSWQEPIKGSEYQLTIKDPAGKIVSQNKVSGNEAQVTLPSLGQYSWSIAPLSNKEYLIATGENSLEMNLPKVQDKPPIKDKQVIYYRNLNGVEAYEIELPEYEYADYYTLEVYRDKEAKRLLFQKSFPKNKGYWVSNRSGKYYYRVRITDKWGRKSGYSKMGVLVFPISPLVK